MTDIEKKIREGAVRYLARREYSKVELRRKLLVKFPGLASEIDAELANLAETGLQSDSRFAESFLRSRADSGFGPRRIRQELRAKGVDEADVDEAFQECGIDWRQRRREVCLKKFAVLDSDDRVLKGKIARFVQYRGFELEWD